MKKVQIKEEKIFPLAVGDFVQISTRQRGMESARRILQMAANSPSCVIDSLRLLLFVTFVLESICLSTIFRK